MYRGFDIGTDKVPRPQRRGIPHHLIDIVEPTDEYTAARYVRDTVTAIEDVYARGHWPILVGGTGLYYRALVRGLFPGPGRCDNAQLSNDRHRRALTSASPARSCRAESAVRIHPRDRKRMIRRRGVFLTGTPMTDLCGDLSRLPV